MLQAPSPIAKQESQATPSKKNATQGHRLGSASKSNIIAVDESVASLVDFDLSESKFTLAGMFDKTNNDSRQE